MSMKNMVMKAGEPVINPITKSILKKFYKSNQEVAPLGGFKKVVVLAPHMDDETIGLGGTIRKHVETGAEVHCVFSTDGSNSESDLPKEELSQMRKEEMQRVNEILGMDAIHYMDLPDGQVTSNQEAQDKLLTLLNRIQPDLIYCTPFVDAHPDHTGTTAILSDTLKRWEDSGVTVRLYEINCPIPPSEINCVIDISETFDRKEKAIQQFDSQAIAFDGFMVLNRVKAHMLKDSSVQAAEVFIELPGNTFVEQFDTLHKKNYAYHRTFKQANRTVTLLWAIYKNYPQKKRMYRERLYDEDRLKEVQS